MENLLKDYRAVYAKLEPEIKENTEKYRKGDFRIQVTDAAGEPLKNTEIRMKQKSHAFDFGCNGLMLGQLGEGNEVYEQEFVKLFELVTTTFCWSITETEPGKFRFAEGSEEVFRRPPADRVLKFAEKYGLKASESAVTDEYLIQNVPYTYYLLDGTKEAFRYLNNCYNSGLINPDFPLFGQTELGEQIASGQVAFFAYTFYSLESYMDALHNAEEDAEIVAVELIHEDGSPAYYATATGVGAYCMVSNTCENVEAALKLIHWFMTSETAHLITQHGTEGEHFEVVDGVYTVIDAEYNKVDRVRCNDLNIALNSDPCWSDEAYLALSEKEVQNSYHAKTAQARIDGTALSWSEGKFQFPAVNTVIQASTDYAVELAENADNLINESIMTTVDKFDEVYDNYYEIYMNEGGSQYAEEALAFYNR